MNIFLKKRLKFLENSDIISACRYGVGVLYPFAGKNMKGGLDNDGGQMRQSYRFGSVRQEHSALFAVCQVISHKNNRKFTAGDGASCALPLAFLYLGAVMPYGNAKAAVK